ncbi:MAG TPA: hypothetical protein VK968_20960 [Roseimicrobium sp.]|nr:hypothetical protein [Roseimicrobium sp.]
MKFDATMFHRKSKSAATAFHRFAVKAALCVFLLIGLGAVGVSSAQAMAVTDATGWIAWNSGLTGNYLADPGADQQTGQGTDDYIGNASTPAMTQQAGTISGYSGSFIMFRARMGKYSASGFGAGNGANLSYGMDLNDNGSLDIIVDMNSKGSVNKVMFAQPGTGTNTGPSTTSWGNFFGDITLDTDQFDYRQTTDSIVLNSNGTAVAGTENGSTGSSYAANAWVTYALSYANLQAAIRAYAKDGLTGETFAGYVLDDLSHMSFVGFTSTQGNAINQDLLGTEGNTSSTLTFSQLGTSTSYIRPGGGPIPEPSAFFQMGGLLGTGLIMWACRRKRRPEAVPTAQGG